ncbi:hypothetical protein R1sor_024736 [Riccia sorocarpa]|uniref:BTB domain-containing protein n=1 Tax=Riccia sorocarpa TaxID=122646 RepID=A0ABD3GRB6_9MARC
MWSTARLCKMESLTAAEKEFESLVARTYEENNEGNSQKQIIQALATMMNDKELSDLLFVCNDGVSLSASRLWLRARSVVFHKVLSADIKEIALDDVSSRVLSIVFEFLYTGSVPSFVSRIHEDEMDRWSEGLAIIRAARHLLLSALERLIWNSLIIDVWKSAADKDLTNTALRLSTLVHFISGYESIGNVEETISLKLVRILHPGWLGMRSITTLSEEGLLFLLENTGGDHESQFGDEGVIGLREYLRLRQVILWCISQRLEVDSAVSMLERNLPCANAAMKLLKEPGNSVFHRNSSPGKRIPAASTLAKTVLAEGRFRTIFLSLINLRLIHPVLLVKVLEPLKIIPPSKYMKAFRFHALKRPLHTRLRDFTWQYCKGSFEIVEAGTVETREGLSGTALVSSSAFWEDRVYKWNVTIKGVRVNRVHEGTVTAFQWGIGMIMSDTPQAPGESLRNTLVSQKNGWALIKGSDSRVFIKRGVSSDEDEQADCILYATLPHAVDDDNVGTEFRIGVVLDMVQKTCSFTLNGVHLGVAWTDLPSKYYFPAVSFFSNSMYSLPQEEEVAADLGTTVRVELLDGFDFEESCSIRKRSRASLTSGSESSASGADVCQPDIIQLGRSSTESSS